MSDKPTALLVESLTAWHDSLYEENLGNPPTAEDWAIITAFTELLNDDEQLVKVITKVRAHMVSTVLQYLTDKVQPVL